MLMLLARFMRLAVAIPVGLGLLGAISSPLPAKPPTAAAHFDPSDVYFQGYLAVRAAEQLESTGEFSAALEKLQKASQLFGAVRQYYPDWKPEMVGGRLAKTSETLERIRPQAQAQLRKNQSIVAELEGGTRKSAATTPPERAADDVPPPPQILDADPLTMRRLADAQAEVQRLKALTAKTQTNAQTELERLQAQAKSAQSHAQAEVERLRNLTVRGETQAQSEIARLRDENARAEAQTQAEIKRLFEQSAKTEAQKQAEVRDLQARNAKIEAEKQAAIQRIQEQTAKAASAAEAEIQRLKQQAEATRAQADATTRELAAKTAAESRETNRRQDIERQNEELGAKLRAAEINVESLRARLATAPMENDLKALNQRIASLEQEREAMGLALGQSRSAHTEALARIATLEADLKIAHQQQADLSRDLKSERQVASSVVAGQRRQLEKLEADLKRKDAELNKAQVRITGLMRELDESHAAFNQLRGQHDALLLERDQMAAVLKLNEASRIQDLIEQNMALAKNLREANQRVDRLSSESNADKDASNAALRDLAIAKSQINRLQQEKRDQDQRLKDLEAKLKGEEEALAKQDPSSDPEEVEVLREIIKRQLRVQERRRQARELLIEAAKELGSKDERLASAIELFETQEIALTPEEQKLIANQAVDGEFVSPVPRDQAAVGRATVELNRDISVFERTAEKSYLAGRLMPTRELYQMIIEQHPGHTPSLCKLGVVHLRLDDPGAAVDSFRRAVELDQNNAYAHRMLGFAFMKLNDLPAAEQTAKKAVDLDPNDAKSRILLATLCYRLGRSGEAESHFKAAVTADPVPSEPYFNLALICARAKRWHDARQFYQQALEHGALPDPELEASIQSRSDDPQ